MREVFVHAATLTAVSGNDGAPGAAITAELCGHWDHDGPCPVAPHHTSVERDGDQLQLRVVFAVERDREEDVRERIDAALRTGGLNPVEDPGADEATSRWRLVDASPAELTAGEAVLGDRLASTPES